MGVVSDPSAFYAVPGEDWAQGDLVVAPTAALWHAGGRQVQKYPQPAPRHAIRCGVHPSEEVLRQQVDKRHGWPP